MPSSFRRPIVAGFVAAVLLAPVPPPLDAQTATGSSAIRHVAAGEFAFVVKGDGSVIGWGREEPSLAAREPSPRGLVPVPIPIALPASVRQMAVGKATAYALTEAGTVLAWGANDSWQLGNSPSGPTPPRGMVERARATPGVVPDLRGVTQIAAGGTFAIALTSDGKVYGWGATRVGPYGGAVGRPVPFPELTDIVQIAAAANHCVALGRDGRVWSWGRSNEWGELGRDAGDAPWTPGVVPGLDRVVSVAAGGAWINASGAVRDDGTVWVWGGNQSSMMGNGKNVTLGEPGSVNPAPMPVKGVTGAKSIVMSPGHVAVLLGDGTLRMWGHDGWGQVGVGTAGGYQPLPKQPRITGVAAVYLGGNRSFAVRTDGTLWFWGPGFPQAQGVLGKNQYVPVQVALP